MKHERRSIDELLATQTTIEGHTNLTNILARINALGYEERIEELEEEIVEHFGWFRSCTTSHALAGSGIIDMEQPETVCRKDIERAWIIMTGDAMEGADEMSAWLEAHGPQNDWYGRERWLQGILARVVGLERKAMDDLTTREKRLVYSPGDIDKFIANPPFAPEPEEPHHFDNDHSVDTLERIHELEQEICDLWDAYCYQTWTPKEGAEFQHEDRQASEDSTGSINAWLDTRGPMSFEYGEGDSRWIDWQVARERWLRSIWPIFDAAAQATSAAWYERLEASCVRKTGEEAFKVLPASESDINSKLMVGWKGSPEARKDRVAKALAKLEEEGRITREGGILKPASEQGAHVEVNQQTQFTPENRA